MLWFLFGKILYMSAAATCGGFLIYIFSKIFSKVLSKKTVYYLWLLPLLAAVIPFSNGYIPKTAARTALPKTAKYSPAKSRRPPSYKSKMRNAPRLNKKKAYER